MKEKIGFNKTIKQIIHNKHKNISNLYWIYNLIGMMKKIQVEYHEEELAIKRLI